MSGLLVQWNMGRLEMIVSVIMHQKMYIKLNKDYENKFSKTTGIEIQSQNWGGNRLLSMEVVAVEYFPNSVDPGSNEKSEFHSYISDENEQDECDLHARMFCLLKIYIFRNISVWYVNSMGRHRWLCQEI